MKLLLRCLLWPFKVLLALLILFEDWGWEPLQRVLAAVGRWPGFRWIERWVRGLPPYAALALFAAPALLLLPIKLAALWAIQRGHALLGVVVIVAAKLVGTAIVARLFTLTRPSLMRLAWFAHWHGRWVGWKDQLLAWVRASAAWRWARAFKAAVRALWS
jgi:hypothetical protein